VKPRLPSGPRTDYDYVAWMFHRRRRDPVFSDRYWLMRASAESDRRDADLMLLAQETNGTHIYVEDGEHWGCAGQAGADASPEHNWVRIRGAIR